MELHLRLETPADYRDVEVLTREAFWGFSRPTCDEHYLVHNLRKAASFVPELDFVAEADGKLVGNIMYTKAKIVDAEGQEYKVLTFGPLSVLPAYQRRGVGSALMRHSIAEAKRLGYRAIVFYGHTDYYPRFGFYSAKAYGITSASGTNFDALMALPLYDGALDGVSGAFHEDPLFNVSAEEAAIYDGNFPPKAPATLLSIDVLLQKLEPAARQAFTQRNIETLTWLNRLSGREMLAWEGIDELAMEIVNQTLMEHGFSAKLLPTSPILHLAEMGVRIPRFKEIRSKAGISVYQVESEGERFILKVFEKDEDTREIANYKLLASLGIPTLPLLKATARGLLLPDVEVSAEYRLGLEEDLFDVEIARALALWYRTLHDKGRLGLVEHSLRLYDENDVLTLENLQNVASLTGTAEAPFWAVLHDRFEDLRRLIDAMPRTLTYNDFYWTNLVVAKDKSTALMLDYNLLGQGMIYSDFRNVTSSLRGEAKQAFLQVYGEERLSGDEKLVDDLLAPLVNLIFACRRESFPGWAEDSLMEVKSGALLEKLRRCMELFG